MNDGDFAGVGKKYRKDEKCNLIQSFMQKYIYICINGT